MKTSEKTDSIMAAIAAVQAATEEIAKNKTVNVEGDRAKWASAYATLTTLDKAIRSHVIAQGIALVQSTDTVAQLGPVLLTRAAKGDQWVEIQFPIKPSRDGAQGFGGGITFAKRWSICALFNLVPDDAEEGQGYKDAAKEGKAPRRAAAPTGLGGLLENIRNADLDDIGATVQKARATHPSGEGAASVERTIAAWFVNVCDNANDLDRLTGIRDAANKIKPQGTDVRTAIQRAAARLEPR